MFICFYYISVIKNKQKDGHGMIEVGYVYFLES